MDGTEDDNNGDDNHAIDDDIDLDNHAADDERRDSSRPHDSDLCQARPGWIIKLLRVRVGQDV